MSQSIAHVLVAACVVQVVMRVGRVRDPDLRVRFRALPLVLVLVALPAFFAVAPWRTTSSFRDGTALFAGSRWAALTLFGIEVNRLVFAVLVVLGVALLLADLARIVVARGPGVHALPRMRRDERDALAAEVAMLGEAVGVRPPRIAAVDTPEPMLFVGGWRRPTLVVSRGALDALDARERRAALAHELVHVARQDALTGWVLLACRVALAFNPAAHIVARSVARELEWRADALAARALGDRDALGSALAKLSRGGAPSPAAPRIAGRFALDLLRRGRLAAVAERRRRLEGAPGDGVAFGGVRLAGTGIGLALLLFFVV